jgi:hypothetical protein
LFPCAPATAEALSSNARAKGRSLKSCGMGTVRYGEVNQLWARFRLFNAA